MVIVIVIVMKGFLNPEGYQNRISGSKVKVILLKGLILSIGGVAFGKVCSCSQRSKLVFYIDMFLFSSNLIE